MRNHLWKCLAVGFVIASTIPARGQSIFEGITVARHDLELGFEINGVVAEVAVEPGQHVKEGMPLVLLNSLDAQAQVAQLKIRSTSTFEIDAAKAEWELGKIELEQMKEAFARGGATDFEVKRKALEAERNRLSYELFRQRQEEARLQLKQAEVNVERYALRAPRDGIVETIAVSKGEMVREVTPVLRFVDISALRVEVPTPSRLADRLRVGGPASVDLDGPEGDAPIAANIFHIAAVGDPASGLRTVTLEFANPDERAAGDTVLVEYILLPQPR